MTVSDWLTLGNVILTTFYVVLTLSLVIITGKSLALSREQVKEAKDQSKRDLEESAKQSQAALEASARQSQAAIEAVREQIRASEQQSQAAIEAVHEQIRASERQAQDTLYNQFKPVVVPLKTFLSPMQTGAVRYSEILLVNKGPGIALNAWGLLAIKNNPQKQHFMQTYFLVPGGETQIELGEADVKYGLSDFEGYRVHPIDGADGLPVYARLMVTYNDVFENKYLSIFDFVNELGWRQIALQKVDKRLDELVIMHKPSIAP